MGNYLCLELELHGFAVEEHDSKLYVGGYEIIAKLDENSWELTPVPGVVHSFRTINDNLLAMGDSLIASNNEESWEIKKVPGVVYDVVEANGSHYATARTYESRMRRGGNDFVLFKLNGKWSFVFFGNSNRRSAI